jgi:hypothetical protein
MEPLYCKDSWIPGNLVKMEQIGDGYVYVLTPPVKISDTNKKDDFYRWTKDGKETLNYDNEWSTLKEYMSELVPYTNS